MEILFSRKEVLLLISLSNHVGRTTRPTCPLRNFDAAMLLTQKSHGTPTF